MSEPISWEGAVVSVQPRIRLLRSFDQRSHSYLGYVARVDGIVAGATRQFVVAIGKAAQEKHGFRAGDRISGQGHPVRDPRLETAELYEVSGLRLLARSAEVAREGPPFLGVPPSLERYRERGHRRLAVKTYATKCTTCIWGCEMPVEMIPDHWNPTAGRRYRRETFCYGPKNCPTYKPGPTRKVPGRKGASWEEEDWVDEDATSHREPDD